jgi:hypothetical protein
MEERESMTSTMLDDLPNEIDRDISLVLLLAPNEVKADLVSRDFDNPMLAAF